MHYFQHFAKQVQTFHLTTGGFQHEVHNNYKFIQGRIVLAGRQPDGDSVAFIPEQPAHFNDVYRGYLLHPSSRDGSVQLRLEGIDAPELHYGTEWQPLGVEARGYLIEKLLHFQPVYNQAATPESSTTVVGSEPGTIPAWIATNALEVHGRPVSYLFTGDRAFTDGQTAPLDQELLKESLNFRMLEAGMAYLLAYTSMPMAHFRVLKGAANAARESRLGVWAMDASHDFVLADKSSVSGSSAQLIYPKLFRRCIEYFRSGELNLQDWMRKASIENDQVRISERTVVDLASLIVQVNDHIYFQADTNDIQFVEK